MAKLHELAKVIRSKNAGALLTRIRVITANGSTNLQAGSVTVRYLVR